ncbi:unnamed protein product [Amoebophrya sp. A120]|nr:unnamed protein product [Amoebophrya sp. A120]|eukprot:GSA120T00016167001.1
MSMNLAVGSPSSWIQQSLMVLLAMRAPTCVVLVSAWHERTALFSSTAAMITATSPEVLSVNNIGTTSTTSTTTTTHDELAHQVERTPPLPLPLPAFEELARRYERDFPETNLTKVFVADYPWSYRTNSTSTSMMLTLKKHQDVVGSSNYSIIPQPDRGLFGDARHDRGLYSMISQPGRGLFAKVRIEKGEIVATVAQPLLFRCHYFQELGRLWELAVPMNCAHGLARTILAAEKRSARELERTSTRNAEAAPGAARPVKIQETLSEVDESACQRTSAAERPIAIMGHTSEVLDGWKNSNSTSTCAAKAANNEAPTKTKRATSSFLDYAQFLPKPGELGFLWKLPDPILRDLTPFSQVFAYARGRAKARADLAAERQMHKALLADFELDELDHGTEVSTEALQHAEILLDTRLLYMLSEAGRRAIIPFFDMAKRRMNANLTNTETAGFAATGDNKSIGAEALRATRTILPGEEIFLDFLSDLRNKEEVKNNETTLLSPEDFFRTRGITENEWLVMTSGSCNFYDPKPHQGLTRWTWNNETENVTTAARNYNSLPTKACEEWQDRLAPHRATLATQFPRQLGLIDCLYADLCRSAGVQLPGAGGSSSTSSHEATRTEAARHNTNSRTDNNYERRGSRQFSRAGPRRPPIPPPIPPPIRRDEREY